MTPNSPIQRCLQNNLLSHKGKLYKFTPHLTYEESCGGPYTEKGSYKFYESGGIYYLETLPSISNDEKFVFFQGFILESHLPETISLNI